MKVRRFDVVTLTLTACLSAGIAVPQARGETHPVVVTIKLDTMVNQVSAGHIIRGIAHANEIDASAILLEIDTPGGLQNSMRGIVQAILDSKVPVITYVTPSGGSATSAGFFILLSGDLAVMAPGTTAGAAHPVVIFGANVGKTMETKIENDAAAYIRTITEKRGRNAKLAEDGVRESKSYTDKEALEGRLVDAILARPDDILAKFDGKSVQRVSGATTTLRLGGAVVEPFRMTRREQIFVWVADPNIAFLLGALGLALLYIEFTHPGVIAPGVVGALALVLALYAFNLLPINILGVLLIVLAIVLFVMEAYITSHGVLAAGGVVAMVIGALILVDSPWPEARIRLSTALAVTLPLAVITVILARFAFAAQRSKAVTGAAGMMGSTGVAQTDLTPEGKVLVRGEIWNAWAEAPVSQGERIRVKAVEGLTLLVEKVRERG